jgi:hypothetical protein
MRRLDTPNGSEVVGPPARFVSVGVDRRSIG